MFCITFLHQSESTVCSGFQLTTWTTWNVRQSTANNSFPVCSMAAGSSGPSSLRLKEGSALNGEACLWPLSRGQAWPWSLADKTLRRDQSQGGVDVISSNMDKYVVLIQCQHALCAFTKQRFNKMSFYLPPEKKFGCLWAIAFTFTVSHRRLCSENHAGL